MDELWLGGPTAPSCLTGGTGRCYTDADRSGIWPGNRFTRERMDRTMLYLIDSADQKAIESLVDVFPIEGVTTNPALISKSRTNVREVIREIRSIIGQEKMLHVQTISVTYDKIMEEAKELRELAGDSCYIKIPVNNDGVKAIKMLKKEGFHLTATAIFTPQQAMVAAKAGADFVAPYINRLDNISSDGSKVAGEIVKLFEQYHLPTKVLAASFNNVEQVHKACLAGVDAATISPEIYEKLIYHPLTDLAIMDFIKKGREFYQ